MVNLDVSLTHFVRGKTVVSKLEHLGLETVGDLLWYPPRRMYRWGELTPFRTLSPGADVTLFAVVMSSQLGWTRHHDKAMLTVVLQDELASENPCWGGGGRHLTVRFFAKHPSALQCHVHRLEKGAIGVFAGKLSGKIDETGALLDACLVHPEYQVLEDYDPDIAQEISARPQPLYRATAGLPSWKIDRLITSVLAGTENIPEAIPTNLREKWGLPTAGEAVQWLHHPRDDFQHERALNYLRYREALTLGAALAKVRNQTRQRHAWALPLEGLKERGLQPKTGGKAKRESVAETEKTLVEIFQTQLPFVLTDGQEQVWREIAADMAQEFPMNRLLQGEVGSGKTVIAAMAAILAVQNGHQAAFMAPTEVLAHQHFVTLSKLLGQLSSPPKNSEEEPSHQSAIGLRLLVGGTSAKEKQDLSDSLARGEPLIVVGTHALLSKSVKFSNLALAIVDEQHRFGVEQRVALLESGLHAPHFLAMTATPIPRTVAMTVFGDLDVSVLAQLPRGRGDVQTFLVPEENLGWVRRAWQRAAEEIREGGRVYVLCAKKSLDESAPMVNERSSQPQKTTVTSDETEDWDTGSTEAVPLAPGRVLHSVEETTERLRKLSIFADIGIGFAHSGLEPKVKQQAIDDFASGKTPLLVSTTVIEVGMDVPEASMMIILDADRFGISQLHQLRGRIGRGSRSGVCLAIAPFESGSILARQRLEAFSQTRDGFALAEADLRIRHEGDILGDTQAGRNSRLQILSLATDANIIESAKYAAEKLVTQDPQLSTNPELARLVFNLGQSGKNLTKS